MYPLISDKNFEEKISIKKEFYDNRIDSAPPYVCLQPYQKLLSNYMSILTMYNAILINHSVGLGKTLSAISICEALKTYYKPFILTKNNIILENFKQEILSDKCSLKPDIKDYSFYTYGDLNKYKVKSLKQKVIVIDEAHNITNNNYYKTIMEILKNSKKIKLVLLSATPIFDGIIEAFHIINLLSIVDRAPLFPNTLSKLREAKIIKKEKDDVSEQESVYHLTKHGEEEIIKKIKGKVSFLISDTQNFPVKIFKGTYLTNEKSIKIYKTKMSSFQTEVYKKYLDDPGILYKNQSDASTIVYPDGSIGEKGFKKYKDFKFTKDILKKYSCKLWEILNSIQTTKGIIFVFSNYVNNGGTSLIKKILNDNGINKYGTRSNTMKYFSFDESMSPIRKTKILSILNSNENKNGDLIKVVIGSPLVSEGLTFKNIKQIHILEPYWNLSRIDQVIGRGVRFKSHQELPVDQRKVEIFLHAATTTFKTPSVDEYKYSISQSKDYNIKKIELLFKVHSLDCFFNKPRNKLKNEHDFTRECQYEKCEYMCPYETKIKEIKTSKDTYSIKLHGKEEYLLIQDAILKFFKKVSVASVNSIIDNVRKYELEKYNSKTIYKKNIYLVLDDMVKENTEFKNSKGNTCVLIKIDKYYVANPKNNKINESLYKKIFVKM